jgi:HK97 family phage prohead protease
MPEYPDLWIRTAELVDVSFPERTIELVVMPYETGTIVHYAGRLCTETIGRGAFAGIERRANRVRVNRDHNLERTVGRAVALHPSRDEGLVAEIRIAKTELGEETLQLAADGCLDASAGFRPMDGGLEWEGRDAYRITKGWLGHIAMTPDPAYEGARVLAVRSASSSSPSSAPNSATPNLDRIREWRLADRVAGDPLLRADAPFDQ